MNWINKPWPWYIAGPLIGMIVPVLLLIGNKTFGISSSLRHTCAAFIPLNIKFFKYDWKKEIWNIFFVIGIVIGGLFTLVFIPNTQGVNVHAELISDLKQYGITDFSGLVPSQLFSWNTFLSLKGFTLMVVGGLLVGFGSRYAGGCTSGHAISGLSNMQWPSLVATCCFMLGGFIMANFVLPLILKF